MKRTNSPQTNGTTNGVASQAAQLQMLSALASRVKLASQLGLSHGGDRDIYSTLGYPATIKSKDLIAQWKRQDVARAIIDRPTKATWQGEVYITEPNKEDESDLEKAYKALDKELGLKQKLARADRLAQLGRYAVILLGYDDSSRQTWAQPVTEGERSLKYIKVVSEVHADIDAWERDPANKRYGLPRIYNIKLDEPGEENTTIDFKVHWTRIVHVAFELLEDEIEGEPILVTAFNRLKDIEKLVGGSAEMYWRGARPGYAGNVKEDYQLGDESEEKLQEQLREYENDLRRFIMAEGVDLESLAQQIADPKGHVDVQMMMLSSLTGIPLRILTGSERGELASSQDSDHWKEWVQNRREETAEVSILRPFVDALLERGVLPEPADEDQGYSVVWPDLFSISEKDQSEIAIKYTDALNKYTTNLRNEELIPFEAFLRYVMKFDNDTVQQIIEMHEAQMEDLIAEEDALEEEARAIADEEVQAEEVEETEEQEQQRAN